MKSFFASILIAASLIGLRCEAQEVLFQVPIASIPCNGQSNIAGGNQVIYLENYFDALQTQLPAILPIVETTFWVDGIGIVSGATNGNVTYAIDPGLSYVNLAGYPATQYTWPWNLKSLGQWESLKGSDKQHDIYPAPVNYTIGQDALMIAPECNGGGTLANPMLTIGYLSKTEIPSPPAQNYLVNIAPSALMQVSSNLPYTTRSSFPAPTVAVESIRVHVLWPEYHGPAPAPPASIAIPHLSVGTQSGSTSSTLATPQELTFNKQPGVQLAVRQMSWSDCISFSSPAGAGILVSASVSVAWTYSNLTGYPSWFVQDGTQWNAAGLSGTVMPEAGRVYAVDRVQINCK